MTRAARKKISPIAPFEVAICSNLCARPANQCEADHTRPVRRSCRGIRRMPAPRRGRTMLATAVPTEHLPVFHFSTNHFAESERSGAWQDVVGRRLLKVEIEPLSASRLHFDIELHALPGLAVLFGSGAGACVGRTAVIDSEELPFDVWGGVRWDASKR